MSYFLDFCFYEGSVFGFWLPCLAEWLVKWCHKEEWKFINETIFKTEKRSDKFEKAVISISQKNFLYKIFGGCLVCSNVWQCMIVFNILFWIAYFTGNINGWWYFSILPYIFFSSFLTRKISKND